MVKMMARERGLDKPVTNHSLQAYGVTKLFQANVPEKLIMERSEHCSTDGLQHYEQTDNHQVLQISNALASQTLVTAEGKTPQPQIAQYPSTQPLPTGLVFSGCTFNNCTFQIAPPVQAQPL